MSQATSDVERIASDYEDLWNGDFSKLDVVSESVRISDPAAPEGEVQGRDAFEAYLRETRTAFPDFHVTVDEMIADEGVVMLEWTVTATHEGEFNEIDPTGREVEIEGMSKFVISDGKLQEDRIYYDLQEMLAQLGVTEE